MPDAGEPWSFGRRGYSTGRMAVSETATEKGKGVELCDGRRRRLPLRQFSLRFSEEPVFPSSLFLVTFSCWRSWSVSLCLSLCPPCCAWSRLHPHRRWGTSGASSWLASGAEPERGHRRCSLAWKSGSPESRNSSQPREREIEIERKK